MKKLGKLLALALAAALLLAACSGGGEETDGESSTIWEMEESDGGPAEPAESSTTEPEEPEPEPEHLDTYEITEEEARELLQPGEEGVILISTGRHLAALACLVNAGDGEYSRASYRVENNISLAGYDFTPIGGGDGRDQQAFDGVFDGGGHLISGLTVRDAGFQQGTGLFGAVGPRGSVSFTHVIEAEVSGMMDVGGLVGSCLGFLYDCSFRGQVSGELNGVGGLVGTLYREDPELDDGGSMRMCAANAAVYGGGNVGGLVGLVEPGAVVEDSYALNQVILVDGSVGAAHQQVGGLVGGLYGEARRCYAVVEVYTRVPGQSVGGLIGYCGGAARDCHYNGSLVSNLKVAGGMGEGGLCEAEDNTVEELTSRETYQGWDFETVWDMAEDYYRGLPFLR